MNRIIGNAGEKRENRVMERILLKVSATQAGIILRILVIHSFLLRICFRITIDKIIWHAIEMIVWSIRS